VTGASERVRLFVALELPEDVRGALLSWAREQSAGVAQLRMVGAESLHVTLCFLGPRPAEEVDAIAGAYRRAVAGLRAPELTVAEAVWLPPRRPRVLAVQLTDGAARLSAVQSAASSALMAGGFYAPERRPFLAHVTVARVRREARIAPRVLDPPMMPSFIAGEVTLFRSRLGQGPARYEALVTETLAG
jgi:2'-5' RNA ligase